MEDEHQLALQWIFGISTEVVGNVIDLGSSGGGGICYAAGHTGVIYDRRSKQQIFLQAHRNAISCMACTPDRSLLITADQGPGSLLVVWSSDSAQPVYSLAQPQPYGLCAMDISQDGQLMITLSAPDPETGAQQIALWDLACLITGGGKLAPVAVSLIPAGDVQHIVKFNGADATEVMSNGKRRVFFWHSRWPGAATFEYYSPPLVARDFKQSVGDFVTSVFAPNGQQALTSTTDGDVVLWDARGADAATNVDPTPAGAAAVVGGRGPDRTAIKVMRIHASSVTFLGTVGAFVVSGGEDGCVRFFDRMMRIVAWFEDLDAGAVIGVSFSPNPPDAGLSAGTASRPDSTQPLQTQLNRFIAPNFVVATAQGKLLAVESASFNSTAPDRRGAELLLAACPRQLVDIASHPGQPQLAVLAKDGLLQLWDLETRQLTLGRELKDMVGTCLVYARDGSFLVVGTSAGQVAVLDAVTLQDIAVCRNSGHLITRLTVSHSGGHIAAADAMDQVLLYAHIPVRNVVKWEFIGKHKSHHGEIVGLHFGEAPSGQTRLFSTAADRRLAEYDLKGSTPETGLQLASLHEVQLPAGAAPAALCFAPPLAYYLHNSTETLLLMPDTAHKVRIYHPDQQCSRATYLGPTFGGPITKLLVFRPLAAQPCYWLAYSTASRVVGLMRWPLDGDPAHSMGLIAHPGPISSMVVSCDGCTLLTAGSDRIVNLWAINTGNGQPDAKQPAAAAPTTSAVAWGEMLRDPALLEELKDNFYFAQLSAQGEATAAPREITGRVPIEMVPDLMRAGGYYPSQKEIESIMNHMRFHSNVPDDEEGPSSIDFDMFLMLYCNHRPTANIHLGNLQEAFKELGANAATGGCLSRQALMKLLLTEGEAFTAEELSTALQALTGQADAKLALPDFINADTFASQVLGFESLALA